MEQSSHRLAPLLLPKRDYAGPRCVMHLGAPLSSPQRRCLNFSSSVLRLFALGLRALESRDHFELSAMQFRGLSGNDRPLTHTVTSHLARSLILARWRHSISSEVKTLPSLPLAGGALCTLKLRLVQPSNYRAPNEYSNRRAG